MTQLAEAFDTDPRVLSAFTCARQTFEKWAAIGANELPDNKTDAMQVQLMRWQRDRFGDQSDERMALGVIEEITECEIAKSVEDTEDALGDVMVYAGQLAMNNRLALGPIMQLAEALDTLDPEVSRYIMMAQGALAQVVLKSAQKIRGLDDAKRYHVRLVGSLVFAIARCLVLVEATRFDSETIISAPGIEISEINERPVVLGDVYATIGAEVLQRAAGHSAIPKLTVH